MPIQTVIDKGMVPVKFWSPKEQIESEAFDQLTALSQLPFIFHHIASMPDVHVGKGSCVGTVFATDGAVIPSAVGVDIGCGMLAAQLRIDRDRVLAILPEIRHSIERSVPVGFNANKETTQTVKDWWMKNGLPSDTPPAYTTKKYDKFTESLKGAIYKLGTLGGGNHFIEICIDKEGNVWAMLHSGSRNIGSTCASYFMDLAKERCAEWKIQLPNQDCAYLPTTTPEGKRYLEWLDWCQKYAFENREEMFRRILKDLSYAVNDRKDIEVAFKINCHHNYSTLENHFGKNVLVTRKGAIRARVDDFGIIPGSMGTKSFIVKGKGNPDSFMSCSHGAGRIMSRTKAKEMFDLSCVISQTQGVECRKDEGIIDELPGAYKNIDTVMKNQEDLVEIVAELKQVMCIKG